jgi:hypothetical protein
MDEKRQSQIVESIKKIDPKIIADVLRDILRSDEDEPVRPINPNVNQPK